MLVLPRDVDDLIYFSSRNLARVSSAHAHALAVYLQHYQRRFLAAHAEHSLEHDDDKVHRRVIVIQQDHLEQWRRFDTRLLDFENAAIVLLSRHRFAGPSGTWGQCLMIATDFSRGKPMDGPPLDARATARVKVPFFGALSPGVWSRPRVLLSDGTSEATCSRPVRQAHLFIPVRNMLY